MSKGWLIGGLAAAMMASVVPAPRISLENPTLLYGAAIYKAIVGDAGSALRLLQRSENPAPATSNVRRTTSRCPVTGQRG